jgi:hypothetical protein
MNNYKKEYFNDYCYFLLESNGNDFVLSYSVYGTISESKKNEGKRKFNKKSYTKIKNIIGKHINLKNKASKKEIEKDLDSVELDEYVDSDGTFLTSKTPIYNMWTHPKKTMDQTIDSTRVPGLTFAYGGGRRLYGENEENDNVNEINMKDAFAYDDTEFMDFNNTMKTLKKLGIDDPEERLNRTKQLGKLMGQKVHRSKDGKKVLKQRLVEKEKLDEIRKQKMIKMVEDILTKKGNNHDIMEKDSDASGLSKIINKNLEAIKNLAKKEGISINKLINILKKNE